MIRTSPKKTFKVSGPTLLGLSLLFLIFFLGLYALAIIVLYKLFTVSAWWGVAGIVAYLGKPKITFKR